jgi:hypothetical protein
MTHNPKRSEHIQTPASSGPESKESTDEASSSALSILPGADSILAAWTTQEILTPQPLPSVEDLRAIGRAHIWLRNDPEPWANPAHARCPKERAIYWFVYLGLLDLADATRSLLKLFPDKAPDERADARGTTTMAVIVLDEKGCPIAGKSFLSAFAWGYGRVRAGALRDLAAFPSLEQQIRSRLEERLIVQADDGELQPLTSATLRNAAEWLMGELNLPAEEVDLNCAAVRVPQLGKSFEAPEPELLKSFFIEDLVRVREAVREQNIGPALSRYLGITPSPARRDVVGEPELVKQLLTPMRLPLCRWPVRGRHPLVLMQQAAINHATTELKVAGIAGINGPPGTGKTTLLRDIVAKVVLDRATALARFDRAGDAFRHGGKITLGQAYANMFVLDSALIGHEIVVASSNNKAVENISGAIPGIDAISDHFDPPLRYFSSISDCVGSKDSTAKIKDGATWGLAAAVLGNSQNKNAFVNSFWWNKERGLGPYLTALDRGWNIAGDGAQPPPEVLLREGAPQTEAESEDRWHQVRARFRSAFAHAEHVAARLDISNKALADHPAATAQHARAKGAAEEVMLQLDAARRQLDELSTAANVAKEAVASLVSDRTALMAMRPGFFSRLFSTRRYRAWHAEMEALAERLKSAREQGAEAQRAAGDARSAAQQIEAASVRAQVELSTAAQVVRTLETKMDDGRTLVGSHFPDEAFWNRPASDLQKSSPWLGGEFQAARDELFRAAFDLHRAFIDLNAKYLRHNLSVAMALLKGRKLSEDHEFLRRSIWASLFLVVPVISTTFASVARLFGPMGREQLGWLLVDEAGQAAPQAAAGAIWRASRVVSIGDPLQIEPVVTTSASLIESIFKEFSLPSQEWSAPEVSVQALADRTSWIGTELKRVDGDIWIGSPLRVHRRCEEPMFSISNRIAYEGLMVYATTSADSRIGNVLGPTTWYSIESDAEGKWSPAEGETALKLLLRLIEANIREPDIFFITPFRIVAQELRRVIADNPRIVDLMGEDRFDWVRDRVGTVHTFQGKEAEAVVLVLGAPMSTSAGARYWAGGKPNLLNVAVSRAQRRLYVVGSRESWKNAGVFEALYRSLPLDTRYAG